MGKKKLMKTRKWGSQEDRKEEKVVNGIPSSRQTPHFLLLTSPHTSTPFRPSLPLSPFPVTLAGSFIAVHPLFHPSHVASGPSTPQKVLKVATSPNPTGNVFTSQCSPTASTALASFLPLGSSFCRPSRF